MMDVTSNGHLQHMPLEFVSAGLYGWLRFRAACHFAAGCPPPLQAKECMLFAGTGIASGACLGLVNSIGMATEIGQIQAQIQAGGGAPVQLLLWLLVGTAPVVFSLGTLPVPVPAAALPASKPTRQALHEPHTPKHALPHLSHTPLFAELRRLPRRKVTPP